MVANGVGGKAGPRLLPDCPCSTKEYAEVCVIGGMTDARRSESVWKRLSFGLRKGRLYNETHGPAGHYHAFGLRTEGKA